MEETPQISIIISTYKVVEWLKKTLWGYSVQTYKDFEIIIADDGSGKATKQLIADFQNKYSFPIVHIWQEDNGFQKSTILNKAILESKSNYILVSDGDCVPRKDFVANHIKFREEGYFLSGGYFKLPMDISESISKKDIFDQRCFNLKWLKTRGLKSSIKNKKLTAEGFQEKFFNAITPTNASWNGHNSSGWKKDILAINGFNEQMQYGGEDRELGERLFNNGIKSKQIRYSTICLHLDHARGYKTKASIEKNQGIRARTKSEKRTWTLHGIKKEEA